MFIFSKVMKCFKSLIKWLFFFFLKIKKAIRVKPRTAFWKYIEFSIINFKTYPYKNAKGSHA